MVYVFFRFHASTVPNKLCGEWCKMYSLFPITSYTGPMRLKSSERDGHGISLTPVNYFVDEGLLMMTVDEGLIKS